MATALFNTPGSFSGTLEDLLAQADVLSDPGKFPDYTKTFQIECVSGSENGELNDGISGKKGGGGAGYAKKNAATLTALDDLTLFVQGKCIFAEGQDENANTETSFNKDSGITRLCAVDSPATNVGGVAAVGDVLHNGGNGGNGGAVGGGGGGGAGTITAAGVNGANGGAVNGGAGGNNGDGVTSGGLGGNTLDPGVDGSNYGGGGGASSIKTEGLGVSGYVLITFTLASGTSTGLTCGLQAGLNKGYVQPN